MLGLVNTRTATDSESGASFVLSLPTSSRHEEHHEENDMHSLRNNAIAAKEQKRVVLSKIIMGFVLIGAAITMGGSTFRVIHRSENREFEREVSADSDMRGTPPK